MDVHVAMQTHTYKEGEGALRGRTAHGFCLIKNRVDSSSVLNGKKLKKVIGNTRVALSNLFGNCDGGLAKRLLQRAGVVLNVELLRPE